MIYNNFQRTIKMILIPANGEAKRQWNRTGEAIAMAIFMLQSMYENSENHNVCDSFEILCIVFYFEWNLINFIL